MGALSLLLAALVAQAPATAAPQWEQVFEEGGRTFWVDTANLRRDGDVVDARVRQVWATPLASGLAALVIHSAFNCRRSTAITFSMEGYNAAGVSLGPLVYGADERPNEPVSRGGPDGALMGRICR